jgi:glutaredoxin
MSYVIIKMIKNSEGKELPVILLNGQEEVWSFEDADEAIKMSELLTKNSDSGYRYYVKKA